MPSATAVFTALAGLLALGGLYVYLFGIPPEMKRKLENKALETMGENKASYLMKDQISKLPASDQKDVKELKEGLGNAAGGLLKNPLGKAAGESADQATRPFTGR